MPDADTTNSNDELDERRIALAALEQLLRDAEAAHSLYEVDLGHRDDNWPSWYARYIWDHLPVEPAYPVRTEMTPEELPSTEPYVSG